MSEFLEIALQAADAADAVVKKYWLGEFEVQIKADLTPVTVADIETEEAIKAVIMAAYPDHGFFGEETGRSNNDSDYLWLIDPIDGTKSFVRGYPFFSTQIALMYKGELIVGVSSAVAYGEKLWAAKGEGAFLNGEAIKVSEIDELAKAHFSVGNLMTAAGDAERWEQVAGMIQKTHRIRGYGDFLHYHFLASGRLEIIFESDLNILDIAALTCIIREAGGVVTQLDGGDIGLETRDMLASNANLRPQVESHFGLCT